MKDELVLTLVKLVDLFSWIIEFLIEYTTSGIALIYFVSFIFTDSKSFIYLNNKIDIFFFYILLPSIIGICLNSFGALIFGFLQKGRKLKNKIGKNIQEEYASLKLHLWNPQNDPNFDNTTEQNDEEYIKKYIDQVIETFKNEFKNYVSLGLLRMTYINIFSPNIKKEVKYTLSPIYVIFNFSLNVFSIIILLFFYSIFESIYSNVNILFYYALPLAIILFLFYIIIENFYKSYLTSIFNIWLSIGEATQSIK